MTHWNNLYYQTLFFWQICLDARERYIMQVTDIWGSWKEKDKKKKEEEAKFSEERWPIIPVVTFLHKNVKFHYFWQKKKNLFIYIKSKMAFEF